MHKHYSPFLTIHSLHSFCLITGLLLCWYGYFLTPSLLFILHTDFKYCTIFIMCCHINPDVLYSNIYIISIYINFPYLTIHSLKLCLITGLLLCWYGHFLTPSLFFILHTEHHVCFCNCCWLSVSESAYVCLLMCVNKIKTFTSIYFHFPLNPYLFFYFSSFFLFFFFLFCFVLFLYFQTKQ